MKVIALSEGAFTIDGTKKFIPFNLNSDQLSNRPNGSLLVEIQPFVVITEKDIIILDTGLGFEDEQGTLQIFNNLLSHNIHPDSVTKVLMSHLHKDHAGGLSLKKPNQESVLTFKNATYFVSRDELENALSLNNTSYKKEDLGILNHNTQVKLLDKTGTIDNYIFYEETGGHSVHHTVFWIKENNDIIFFGGDVAPQLQQMKSRFVAKYDFDGKKSMELRREWLDKGVKENWTFLFYHDIKNPIYTF